MKEIYLNNECGVHILVSKRFLKVSIFLHIPLCCVCMFFCVFNSVHVFVCVHLFCTYFQNTSTVHIDPIVPIPMVTIVITLTYVPRNHYYGNHSNNIDLCTSRIHLNRIHGI